MKALIKAAARSMGYKITKLKTEDNSPADLKRFDESNIEILIDAGFQNSLGEVHALTILDTERLANLWQLCRLSNPRGGIIEIGSYKGGSALHLSNSCPARKIYVCDTFEGFGTLARDLNLDRIFMQNNFSDTDLFKVQTAWRGKGRDVEWIKGYFPESAAGLSIQDLSFAHIDVDLYESAKRTLDYLSTRFIERSIIVLDDYLRKADGLMKAVKEFETKHPEWVSFPIFPGQGLMIHNSWFVR
jgi:O-methyltransferase